MGHSAAVGGGSLKRVIGCSSYMTFSEYITYGQENLLSSACWPEPTHVPTINIPSRNLGLTNRSKLEVVDCLGKRKNA